MIKEENKECLVVWNEIALVTYYQNANIDRDHARTLNANNILHVLSTNNHNSHNKRSSLTNEHSISQIIVVLTINIVVL